MSDAEYDKLKSEVRPLVEQFLSQEHRTTDSPYVAEKRIVEMLRMARTLILLAEDELCTRNEAAQGEIEDFDPENDGMQTATEMIHETGKVLDDGLDMYDGEGDPDGWEWCYKVGDIVDVLKDNLGAGKIISLKDEEGNDDEEDWAEATIQFFDKEGTTVVVRNIYNLDFKRRPSRRSAPEGV